MTSTSTLGTRKYWARCGMNERVDPESVRRFFTMNEAAAGAEHYGEHLGPLRAWVAELIDVRTRPPSDEWDS